MKEIQYNFRIREHKLDELKLLANKLKRKRFKFVFLSELFREAVDDLLIKYK